ncbi:MAG: M13 family metallopeptidase [Clostridia bacterium]|nr:M13 family metallopeptidase [Clostridia bacterium]
MKRIVAMVLIVGMLLHLGTPFVFGTPRESLTALTIVPLRKELEQRWEERDAGPYGDYYDYINGKWIDETSLPYGQNAWSDLNTMVLRRMQEIGSIVYAIHRENKTGAPFPYGSKEQKIADVFLAGSNIALRDSLGLNPVKPYLAMIDDASTLEELLLVMAKLEYNGFHGLFPISITADMKNSSRQMLTFSECYTGMDVGAIQEGNKEQTVSVYRAYLQNLFQLFGFSQPEQRAEQVTDLCVSLALASMPMPEHNQVASHYTVCSKKDREKLFFRLDIEKYLKELGFGSGEDVLFYDLSLAKEVDTIWTEENFSILKDYLRASVMDGSSVYLNTDAFLIWREYQDTLNGVESGVLPADYAISMVEELLGWELAELYVKAYADMDIKQEITRMTEVILKAYQTRIRANTWLSNASKTASLKKLETLRVRVAYPDNMDRYMDQGYTIRPVRKGGNLMEYRTGYCNRYFDLAKISLKEKTDKDRWSICPQTVNALYEPSTNSITIPLGLLDDPFYRKEDSWESKLGRIGTVIAHEISHALDALGSQFDENGNLKDWWQKSDKQAFGEICRQVLTAYDGIGVAPNLAVNGASTLSENLADLAGMTCILDIAGEENPNLEELFAGYAATWRAKTTPAYLQKQIMTDSHAPDKVRVNRVLSNFDAFQNYYRLRWGDGMFLPKKERISIW